MNSKIKVLFICDDIRTYSGVGIQAEKLLTALAADKENFEVYHIGTVMNRKPNPQPLLYKDVVIFEHQTHGDATFTRQVVGHVQPDIVIPMGDPRFFTYLFNMDGDIRKRAFIAFYHLWDNEPFPKFNKPWYDSCDELVTLTKFTHEMYNKNGLKNTFIPHGYDPEEFKVLEEKEYSPMKDDILRNIKRDDIDFTILWNNRNLHRKRGADVIEAFHMFYERHPHSLLIMHTDPVFFEGYDLIGVNDDFERIKDTPVIFSVNKDASPMLNKLYNIADVTVNISYNEGFGLCIGESQLAQTPVIATATGGMTEQLTGDNERVGYLLQPQVRYIFGVPGNNYVYQDFVSTAETARAFEQAYEDKKDGNLAELGKKAREHTMKNYNISNTISLWKSFLKELKGKDRTFKPYRTYIFP